MDKNRITSRCFVIRCAWLLIALFSISCASTDQQGYDEDYGDNFGNYGEDTGGGNNAYSDEYEEEGDASSGEGVNNYSYNEFETGDDLALQLNGNNLALGNNYGMYNQYSDNSYGEFTNNAKETPEDLLAGNSGLNLASSDLPSNVASEAAPINAAADTPMLDAPVNGASQMSTTGGIVKYIRETTSLLNSPNGQPVGSAMKGDHPVVWDEGNYHRDSKGRYIPSSVLSSSGVGRPREGGSWRASGGGGY